MSKQPFTFTENESAREFAHGCWCSNKPHEGWCDGKHHARMAACPHDFLSRNEKGEQKCDQCGWWFVTQHIINGKPALYENGNPHGS